MKKFIFQKGFTITELLVVMGIVSILFGISTINLLSLRNNTSTNANTITFINDFKSQQSKAMAGYTQAETSHNSYGIHLEQTRYTLFKGNTYSSTDPGNFVVTLPVDIQFTNVLFPSSQIVFGAIDGEIVNFTQGSNKLTIRNVNDNNSKTVELNRYGVVTSVN